MVKSEHFLDVRYYETDQMGIVHHSNYIRYFECGRNAMLKEMDMPMEKVEASGVMMAVVSVDAKYKVPAKLGDTLRIVSIIDAPPYSKGCSQDRDLQPERAACLHRKCDARIHRCYDKTSGKMSGGSC